MGGEVGGDEEGKDEILGGMVDKVLKKLWVGDYVEWVDGCWIWVVW